MDNDAFAKVEAGAVEAVLLAKYGATSIREVIERLRVENDALRIAREIAAEQAEDGGLWFVAETITEDYLQRALRRLTRAVEGEGDA